MRLRVLVSGSLVGAVDVDELLLLDDIEVTRLEDQGSTDPAGEYDCYVQFPPEAHAGQPHPTALSEEIGGRLRALGMAAPLLRRQAVVAILGDEDADRWFALGAVAAVARADYPGSDLRSLPCRSALDVRSLMGQELSRRVDLLQAVAAFSDEHPDMSYDDWRLAILNIGSERSAKATLFA